MDPDDSFLSEALPSEVLREIKGLGPSLAAQTTDSPNYQTQALEDEPISLFLGQRNSKHFLFKVRHTNINIYNINIVVLVLSTIVQC